MNQAPDTRPEKWVEKNKLEHLFFFIFAHILAIFDDFFQNRFGSSNVYGKK